MPADVTEKEDTLSFDPQHDILCISALNSIEERRGGGRQGAGRERDERPEYAIRRREIDRCEAH